MQSYKYNQTTKLYDEASSDKVELNPLNKSGEKPLEYCIVIRCEPKKEKTESGIYMPNDTAEKELAKTSYGVIVDLGSKAFEDFPEKPEVGDIVTFKPFRAHETIFGSGEKGEYRLLADKDILSVRLGFKKEDLSWWK